MQLPEMPSLPEGETRTDYHIDGRGEEAFTADQMRAYAEEYALLVLSEASLGACPAGTALCAPAADAASAPIAGAWVSSADRLPEGGCRVLAWDGHIVATATHYGDRWGSVIHLHEPTHWMPLPQPPKEQ
jgi:hypothetical protein